MENVNKEKSIWHKPFNLERNKMYGNLCIAFSVLGFIVLLLGFIFNDIAIMILGSTFFNWGMIAVIPFVILRAARWIKEDV
jgi:hypothetical protein